MKISKVSVKNLFGVFNHEINLKIDDRITIIHGPNGFGKTVILRMIDSMFNNRLSIFYRIPFDSFRIDFDDHTFIAIEKTGGDDVKKTKLSFISSSLNEPIILTRKASRDFDIPLGIFDEFIPELTRVGAQEWRNIRSGQILNIEDIFDQYGDLIELRTGRQIQTSAIKKHVPALQTHVIKADRLRTISSAENERIHYSTGRVTRGASGSSAPAVVEYSQDLARRVQQTLAKSVELSSSLDRSFPMRLVDTLEKGQRKLSDEKIRGELANLEEKRGRLVQAGLLDQEQGEFQLPEREVNESTRLVLSIYIQDVKKKLAIFDEDLKRIELFKDILSRRFTYKKLKIAKNQGFVFTTLDGTDLAPDALSSGEQHEIVLLYELLFRVKENSLILLDEPEISLHIGWQQEFLKDLAAITKISAFDAIIATHSPDIIHDRWDLTVPLTGPEK